MLIFTRLTIKQHYERNEFTIMTDRVQNFFTFLIKIFLRQQIYGLVNYRRNKKKIEKQIKIFFFFLP